MMKTLDKALQYCCIGLLCALLVCVLWQVLSRYLLKTPSTFTEELARFTFIWLALLGAAQCYAHKAHLAIDLLLTHLKPSAQRLLSHIIESLNIAFASVVMIWGGLNLVVNTYSSGQLSPVLGIPMGLIYVCVPLSGLLMVSFGLRNMFFTPAPITAKER